jgi:DNA polymerase-3 subunit beta
MKVSCLQENLSRGLGTVGRAAATRSTLPITQNVLLAAEESRLKLCATNLEMASTCWIGAKVEQQGAITVPARLLSDFVSSLPNELVEMTLPSGSHTLELKCGRFQAHFNGVDAQDFPPIPEIPNGTSVSVEAPALHEGITQVAFAAATEESRPVLAGVATEFEDTNLSLVAADGFRLAVHRIPLSSAVGEKATVIVPARTYNELNRLLADQEEPVQLQINDQKTQILFRLKDAEIVSQLIQGSFPNYSQVIPQSYATRAVMDIDEFARVTRMSSIFARDASGIVRLIVAPGEELTPGKVTVSAQAEAVGDNVSEIDALVDGEEAKIAFNVKYLSDVLSVLRQSQVALEVTTPSSPGVIRPIGVDNYLHVIMPMFVQWS